MNISSPFVDLFCGSSQGSKFCSGSQETWCASPSQEWPTSPMPSQTDSQELINGCLDLQKITNKDYETTENDLKSCLDDNVPSQNFYPHSANSQESLQAPDHTRPPAPVVESKPSVVSSCQPSVKPQVRSNRTKVKRKSLPVQKGPARQPPKRKESPECTTVSSSEPFMGHLQSSKRVSSVKRSPLALITNQVSANSVSSTVSYESESRSEHSSLDHLDEPSRVSSITSGFPVISSRPNKQVKAPIYKPPTTAKASSQKSSKFSFPKTSIMHESSQPSRYSFFSPISSSSGRHIPSSSNSTSSNARSIVNTKNMTKQEKELYEMKKADLRERNRAASKRSREKKKKEAVIAEDSINKLEIKNKALETKIEELEVLKFNCILELLQAGVTNEAIEKKLQLANA